MKIWKKQINYMIMIYKKNKKIRGLKNEKDSGF